MTQRGNRRQRVFFSDEDYAAYLALLAAGCAAAGFSPEASRDESRGAPPTIRRRCCEWRGRARFERVWCPRISRISPELAVKARAAGKGFPTPDGYIAAIAASRGFSVASRDASAFAAAGLTVIDPWAAAPGRR